jgi:hypothetical protein
MTAPTKAELAAAWAAHVQGRLTLDEAWTVVGELSQSLWKVDDFRPCETEALDKVVDRAIATVVEAAQAQLRELILPAMGAFAAEHPDAPRPTSVAGAGGD